MNSLSSLDHHYHHLFLHISSGKPYLLQNLQAIVELSISGIVLSLSEDPTIRTSQHTTYYPEQILISYKIMCKMIIWPNATYTVATVLT